jgi:glycosyltransferase involved in cell wall biosynthesis
MKVIRTATVAISLNVLLKGQLSYLNKFYNIIAVSGNDTFLEEVRIREKVRIQGIEISRKINIFKDVCSLVKLIFFFYKEKPLIVHSITPKAGLLSMIAAKITGVPIRMHTFTGLIFPSKNGFLQQILIFMDRLLCSCATHIYPEGQGVKDDLIRYKITKKALKIIANGNVNGIDTAFFSKESVPFQSKESLSKELKLTPKDFVFVFVGRIVGDKGINELVAAFSTFESENVKLLLVGNEEKDLDPLNCNTYKEIVLNKNIITVGFQSDIRPYLAISDCFVFPSYREGFPNVVIQAGSMELPSIVSDINGCNEIIEEGVNGIIIPVKDQKALFNAMRKLASDRDFYSKLQLNTRKMIMSRYEQHYVWACILEEYKNLIKNV